MPHVIKMSFLINMSQDTLRTLPKAGGRVSDGYSDGQLLPLCPPLSIMTWNEAVASLFKSESKYTWKPWAYRRELTALLGVINEPTEIWGAEPGPLSQMTTKEVTKPEKSSSSELRGHKFILKVLLGCLVNHSRYFPSVSSPAHRYPPVPLS